MFKCIQWGTPYEPNGLQSKEKMLAIKKFGKMVFRSSWNYLWIQVKFSNQLLLGFIFVLTVIVPFYLAQ